jgi:hypothetical protein
MQYHNKSVYFLQTGLHSTLLNLGIFDKSDFTGKKNTANDIFCNTFYVPNLMMIIMITAMASFNRL